MGRVGARISPRIRFSGVNTYVRQGAGGTILATSACDQAPQVHRVELSVSPGLRGREKEGPRSPVCILPVYEQSQAKGRGHRWHRSEDKNNPRDRLGSRLSRSRGRVHQCYANRPELSNGQLTSKHLAAAAFPGKRPPLTARAESARVVGECSHAAIPNSFSLATKYSCGRSPFTRLQWAQSSCRFSMLSWPPARCGMTWSTLPPPFTVGGV